MGSTPITIQHLEPAAVSGLGTCCAEAQADGVPCSEIRDCATCSRQPCTCEPEPTRET